MIGRPGTPWSRWSDSGHLTLDAMVAFVDGELGDAAAGRAAAHVDHCLTCAGEVAAQRQARRRLRGADCPGVPSALLDSLRNIPDSAELPEIPAGLGVDAQGRFVVPAEAPPAQGRRSGRRGAGGPRSRRRVLPAVVASGLVAGAAAVVGPVLAAGAVPVAPAPGRTPDAGASLTAAVPAVGERGNPVTGAVVQDAVARAAVTPSPTTPPADPTDATRARPSS